MGFHISDLKPGSVLVVPPTIELFNHCIFQKRNKIIDQMVDQLSQIIDAQPKEKLTSRDIAASLIEAKGDSWQKQAASSNNKRENCFIAYMINQVKAVLSSLPPFDFKREILEQMKPHGESWIAFEASVAAKKLFKYLDDRDSNLVNQIMNFEEDSSESRPLLV
ncbi:hypothetical protein [Candidatus Protochlamydia phocaeensis]|uniref:hypothetical protein n=1 Tax=Candidatus Protochlamydia phocaeensis TaxID=1414722 RepID=UPI0008394248|nr:hypothetical protein [Candidatus Protochlamydia phocaeensis]